jgi:predicted MFS family arabinose efflux permease
MQVTMIGASCLFLVGAGIQAGAMNLTMLVLGRVILGLGVGE